MLHNFFFYTKSGTEKLLLLKTLECKDDRLLVVAAACVCRHIPELTASTCFDCPAFIIHSSSIQPVTDKSVIKK